MKPKNESSLSPARISTWAMFLLSLALLDRLACEVGCLWGQELTSPSSRGAAIWEEQCIACHGGQGEGIEGKYEHRLSGPNTVEELASLIEQTMPEDDPGKCVGEDARAVAEFLLQRILVSGDDQQPARRVLQHLTANQYQLAVADLGEALLGGSEPAGELGLKAKYFDGREYKQDKRVAEQIDPRIDF
ncbi:MAG: cytochrome c, partial [Blastopirellula sp.]|nr:cytochrome c [Blastopirellula sp.]